MDYRYQIYGLHLQSSQPLPGLLPGLTEQRPDLRIEWEEVGAQSPVSGLDWQRLWTTELSRRKSIAVWQAATAVGPYLRLGFTFGGAAIHFTFDPALHQLWIEPAATSSAADLQAHLVGPVLGCFLRRRGVICLHASVLALDGRAILLVGSKKAGKSTTAAALTQQGAALLSDDLAVLHPDGFGFAIQPGYPALRLWPAALAELYTVTPSLPKVYSDREKRYLALGSQESNCHEQKLCNYTSGPATFCPVPLPLAAIYLLDKRLATLTTPIITPLTGQAALLPLLGNTFGNYVVTDALRTQELAQLGQVANTVPIRRVLRPDNLQTLPILSQAILNDFAMTSNV